MRHEPPTLLAASAAISVSEREHGFSTKQFLVSACAGSSKNLKDLSAVLSTEGRVGGPCWGKSKPKGLKKDLNIIVL